MGQTHRLTSRFAAFGLLLAVTSFAGASPAEPGGQSLGWYDLRPIVRSKDTGIAPVDMRLPLRAAYLDRKEVEAGPPLRPILTLNETEIGDFIERSIERSPNATLEQRRDMGGKMLLAADAEGHRIALSIAEGAARWSQAGAHLELFEIPGDAFPSDVGAVLSLATVDEFIASGAARSVGQKFLRFGENGVLGEEATTAYLQDYDVEVASGSVGSDVGVSILRTGARMGLRVELARDQEHVIVRAFGRRSALNGPLRTVDLPAFAGAQLEMPTLKVALFSCSAKLRAGDAMVMHAGDPNVPAIAARVTALDVPSAQAGTAALLFGDMFLGDRRRDPVTIATARPSGGNAKSKTSIAALTAPWSIDELPIATDATNFVDEILSERALATQILPLGNIGLFTGEASDLAKLRAQIDALAAGLSRPTIEIEVAYRTLDTASQLRVAGPADFAQLAADEGTRRLRGACFEGDTMQLVGGRNFAYLQDHDVQIASGSSIMDPVIRHLFEGLSFWCSPIASAGGSVSAWVDLQFVDTAPPIRTSMAARYSYTWSSTLEQQPRASGKFYRDLPLELPETRQARVQGRVPSISQEWSLLAAEPIAGTDKRFVAIIRAAVR